MNLAETKKKNNISEYIIHMYQTEDLMRVYGFDMEKIKEYVIKHIPLDDKQEVIDWYTDISNQMKKEHIEESGHLASVQEIVKSLDSLKDELLESDEEFKLIYKNSKSHIDESMEYAKGALENETQACLNGVYGLLLARMNGKEVPQDIMESIDAFGDVLSYLSYKYKQRYFMNDN